MCQCLDDLLSIGTADCPNQCLREVCVCKRQMRNSLLDELGNVFYTHIVAVRSCSDDEIKRLLIVAPHSPEQFGIIADGTLRSYKKLNAFCREF